ncbi:MAG: DUF1080 domain-containing protein [Verrucomicrobiota bacterium]
MRFAPISLLVACFASAEVGFHSVVADSSEYETPLIPGSEYRVHQHDRPQPPRVVPGDFVSRTAPADADILFDGSSMDQFEPGEWFMKNGVLISGKGGLYSKKAYGDLQMHIEWRTPNPPRGGPKSLGNNGVKLMGLYEIQIFDSYTCKIYADGSAGAVYAQTPPAVNASRKPGEWQTFDIYFTAPVFEGGQLVKPGYVTVLHNGIFISQQHGDSR